MSRAPIAQLLLLLVPLAVFPLDRDEDLLEAARKGDTEEVEALLESGANVNMASANGSTPLMAAALSGHTEVVQLLLGAGAEVNAANEKGSTALMSAALAGHTETVGELLNAGAEVNKESKDGSTALGLATMAGRKEIEKLLIEAGARVSEPGRPDTSPHPIRMPSPKYLRSAIHSRIEGEVVLRVRIDKQGKCEVLNVVRSIRKLDKAAIKVVEEKCLFDPATKDGQPVSMEAEVVVTFKLDSRRR